MTWEEVVSALFRASAAAGINWPMLVVCSGIPAIPKSNTTFMPDIPDLKFIEGIVA